MLKKIPLKSLIPVYKCSIQFNPLYKSLSTFIQSEAFSTVNKYQNDPNIPSSLKASDFLVKKSRNIFIIFFLLGSKTYWTK